MHNLLLQSFVNDIYKYYGNGIALIKKKSVLKPCSNYM